MPNKPRWFIVVKTTVVHNWGMSREDPQFKLRMTEALRDRIAESAKANGRSMNAELIARLEMSFDVETEHALSNRIETKFESLMQVFERVIASDPKFAMQMAVAVNPEAYRKAGSNGRTKSSKKRAL